MQKLQISIPEPCHENWQNMTPSDQGRFCNACAKTVVDFSMMSDHEVLSYFSTVSDDKVCGRTLATQLNREMTMPREPKKRRFWYWNYVAMFFMLFSKSNNAKAQGEIRPITQTVKKPTCNVTMGTMVAPQLKNERVVSGKVTNDKGGPIAGAAIRIREAQTGVSADGNGIYSIKAKEGDVIEFSGSGFETQRQVVRHNTNTLDVTLRTVGIAADVVMFAGAISVRRRVDSDEFTGVNTQPNQVFEIKVRDKETLLPVGNASITIKGDPQNKAEIKLGDRLGTYKIRKIKDGDSYRIIVNAEGYEKNELTIQGSRTDARKIIKEVFLTKKQPAIIMGAMISGLKINPLTKSDTPTTTVYRCYNRRGDDALLVVDNVKKPISYISTIDPNDVQNVSVLKGPEAVVIYGSDASEGVILVTTKRKKQNDSLRLAKAVVKKVANAIGISSKPNTVNLYPNPVRSGSSFVVDLSLQRAGEMGIQITDINGRVVLQKQITSSSKDHLEKIETDERWPAGIYFLNVFNSNGGQQGKLINAVSFVVQ